MSKSVATRCSNRLKAKKTEWEARLRAVDAQEERRKLITLVISLLDITKVGENACNMAVNLVVVNLPEGVKSIGKYAFCNCESLTTISFPTTLTSIADFAFYRCSSLDNADLLHTNLQKLGRGAFASCIELKSMMIPDSLQTLGDYVFADCYKLVPSNINATYNNTVVAYLSSKQN
ncbi:hypothetical protein TrLO_g7550 [Triparma laevis f. longispina]|uniref:Leucine-rich repeat domain-containing protein n=1 Tax=Triparma laevis f. longispina TaxID=1714387 RepID=A0A9W6ZWI9_9STRA|nr:hypothetical protein TrLO_g7550 [Triparma laevis f. longispina]